MLRNKFSFLMYCLKNTKNSLFLLLINLALLIYFLFDFSIHAITMSIGAILLALLINFVWQIYGITLQISDFLKQELIDETRTPFDFSQIEPSQKEKDMGYAVIASNAADKQYAFLSEKVNNLLQTKQYKICRDKGKEKLIKKHIRDQFTNYIWFLKYRMQQCNASSKNFYNENKLCMAHDIQGDTVQCFKSCYYATHVTHHIFGKCITDEYDNIIATSRLSGAVAGHTLWDISTSKASNEIGISTLAFTKNGYLIILTQGKRANASSNLMTPTGSGSADWKDYHADSFHTTIISAMSRELFEEIGKPAGYTAKTLGVTKLLGFFRWVNRMGKPEFFGITKMRIMNTDIFPDKKEMNSDCNAVQEYHIFDQESAAVDFDGLFFILKELAASEHCSFPLFMCIYGLLRYLEEEQGRNEFTQFLLKEGTGI